MSFDHKSSWGYVRVPVTLEFSEMEIKKWNFTDSSRKYNWLHQWKKKLGRVKRKELNAGEKLKDHCFGEQWRKFYIYKKKVVATHGDLFLMLDSAPFLESTTSKESG